METSVIVLVYSGAFAVVSFGFMFLAVAYDVALCRIREYHSYNHEVKAV